MDLKLLNAELGAAIVQRRDLTPGHVGAVFWLSLAAGIGLAGGLWAAAGPIAVLMREPRLVGVLRPLALMVPVHALLVVPRALLQRSMRFKRLAATEVGAEVVLGVVTIGLAYRGYGVWSLVTGLFARHVARAILLWCVRPWRPTLRVSAAECRGVLGFGGFVMGSTLASFCVEAFSLDRLLTLTRPEIEERFRLFKSLTHFDSI